MSIQILYKAAEFNTSIWEKNSLSELLILYFCDCCKLLTFTEALMETIPLN